MRQAQTPAAPASGRSLRAIPPGLHLVSTPIGAARDITLHALDVLAGADLLVAEDTRTLRHLMELHGIALAGRVLLSYHDHSGAEVVERILRSLKDGKAVAYASEAGTPLISDPGFELVRATAAAGLPLTAAPGPCAAICALTVSGLPSDRFYFAGFLPATRAARQKALHELAAVQATLVLYESPRRLAPLLAEMARILGATRRAVVCRELTKRYEEVTRGSLETLVATFAERDIKGEIVVLVDRHLPDMAGEVSIDAALESALQTMSVKDAATFVSQSLKIPRKVAYKAALDRSKG